MQTKEEIRARRKIYRNSPRGKELHLIYSKKYPSESKRNPFLDIHYRYGLTRKEYDALLVSQSGRCAICGEAKPLEVDHNHAGGKVRGLLCHGCNVAVGLINDKSEIAVAMSEYLQ
jgi:hypothetical protein